MQFNNKAPGKSQENVQPSAPAAPQEVEKKEVSSVEAPVSGEQKEPEYDDKAPIGDLIESHQYQLSDKAKRLRKHLALQPKVRVLVPREPNEAKTAMLAFSLNGFNFFVRKGQYSAVPEDVAQMIQDTYRQGEAVLADHPLNLNNNEAAKREFER